MQAAAARVVDGSVEDIDWAAYAEALPEVNIDALKSDFESYLAAIPEITYNEGDDLAEHARVEETARGLQALSSARLEELAAAQAEADDHKLHEHYGTNDMYLRHEGLYEKIQKEVLDREYYKDLDPIEVPEMDDAKLAEFKANLLKKGGLA